ncbi:32 kDa-cell wall symbiosis regulated acidic polypeptide [Pisolithus marmoratus]|nr:32 kDa-cell wall symbiosis regulated acidic polypeptide [Pisolithus marmoratus]
MSNNTAQALAYLESVTLGPIRVGLYSKSQVLEKVAERGRFLDEPAEHRSATIGPILVSLLPNLTRQNMIDVLNSIEFSSRIATKEVGPDDHTAAYWNAFMRSISQIGWFKQQERWSSDFIDGQTTRAENFSDYVIEDVRNDPSYSSAEKDGILYTLNMVRNDPELRAQFRKSTAGGTKGSYGVSAATVNNNTLTLRFSAFMFNCNVVVEDYLTSSIKNVKADVGKNNVDLAANQSIIDAVRKKVEEELSKAAQEFIDIVDLDF